MASSEQMPKFDPIKDKAFISDAQIHYMRLAQEKNIERVNNLKKVRRNNLLTAGLLATGVISIFGYSLWSVGSEKFLSEFDDKKKPET